MLTPPPLLSILTEFVSTSTLMLQTVKVVVVYRRFLWQNPDSKQLPPSLGVLRKETPVMTGDPTKLRNHGRSCTVSGSRRRVAREHATERCTHTKHDVAEEQREHDQQQEEEELPLSSHAAKQRPEPTKGPNTWFARRSTTFYLTRRAATTRSRQFHSTGGASRY